MIDASYQACDGLPHAESTPANHESLSGFSSALGFGLRRSTPEFARVDGADEIFMKAADLTGKKFTRLQVVGFSRSIRTKSGIWRHYWKCLCDCGAHTEVQTETLRYGHTRSCGCLGAEARLKRSLVHGFCHRGKVHPFYRVWQEMIRRCTNSTRNGWCNYGGRGITVCERWFNFSTFRQDMYPTWRRGLTLGRIDNDGNYIKSNCQWETRRQQNNNTRHNRHITAFGKTQTISQWADELNVPYSLLLWRMDEGWNHERIVSQPSRKLNRKVL